LIRENNIELVKKTIRRGSLKVKSVAVGSDHGGFPFKEQLKNFLAELRVSSPRFRHEFDRRG
jgi:hypothetical protein